MSDDIFNDGTFGEAEFSGGNTAPKGTSNTAELNAKAELLLARQAAYVDLAEAFRNFWVRVDVMEKGERDQWIQWLYEQYLVLAPHLGVSLTGLPQLRECCGQKRETSTTLPARVALPPVPPEREELAWWPGDIIRRITRFFGAAYCEKCDRRRRWINSLFGKRY